MASSVVVDSGILIASVLPEPLTTEAKALLKRWHQQHVLMVAPSLLQYEIVAVTRKAVYQQRITPEQGVKARDILLAFTIEFHLDDILLKRAYELATQFNRPTAYDSQYLAVAERLGCEFWTADERLYNTLHNQLTWVKWLGHFSATSI